MHHHHHQNKDLVMSNTDENGVAAARKPVQVGDVDRKRELQVENGECWGLERGWGEWW
jgi:hypothetical protein